MENISHLNGLALAEELEEGIRTDSSGRQMGDIRLWETVKNLNSTDLPNPQGLDAMFHKSTLDKLFRDVDYLRGARSDISSRSIHASRTKSNVSRHQKYSRSYKTSHDVVRSSNNRCAIGKCHALGNVLMV